MTHTYEIIEPNGQKFIGHAPYIDANKPTPTVKGTNVGPVFFENHDIDPASIPAANIKVFMGYAHGEDIKTSVNGEKTDDVKASLIKAGAQPLVAPA